MNTYIYGPKDDPYHSSPNWRKPYPEKEAAQIKDLVEGSRRQQGRLRLGDPSGPGHQMDR